MVRLLGRFVACESPSGDKMAVDRLGRMVAAEWRSRGAKVRVLRHSEAGNHVRAEVAFDAGGHARGKYTRGRPTKGKEGGQILVLGHLDTVYPLGTVGKMPFRVAGGKAWGPGTFDMKAGLVLALFAVDALLAATKGAVASRAAAVHPKKRVVFLWTSDEEVGSGTSRREIEREAARSDAVLVLEPSFGPKGHLKTERKGVGTAEIVVHGRAAHAGIDPEAGVNAVHELALQIARLMKLNDARRGVTVQATVMAGGTVSNVIPEQARAEIDIRYKRLADGRRIERALRGLRPILKGARIEVRGGINRPPLERTPAGRELFRLARSLAREMGLSLAEASTGGASDGNFTAALGVPTIDGLGAVGDGAHSAREHVVVRSLPERAALIAGLLNNL